MKQSKPFALRGKWGIRWSDEHGKRRKAIFASHADAEHVLAVELARVKEVKRGLRLGAPPKKTINELCDYWIEHRARQKRSGHHDESIIRAHLRPSFGTKLVSEISVADIDKFTCDRLHLDKKTLANHLTLLGSMLNLAYELGWLLKVPKIRKPKVRPFGKDFRYLRTQAEVVRFLQASFEEGQLVGTLYSTAINTGGRQGELAALTWDKVDFERRLITIDRSFAGPTKAEDVRYVPILDSLLPVLRAWRLMCPGQLLFPTLAGTMLQPSARVFQETLHAVLDRAGFPKTQVGKRVRRYIVFHDLRHTFASLWVANGGDLFRLQKILGHKTVQMTMRYAHLAPAAFAADHGRLGPALDLQQAVVVHLPVAGP
jgi:integrase